MSELVDREVYAFARQMVKQGQSPTVEACARHVGVSRSTVHRAACRLGYEGWSNLIEQLEHYHRPAVQSGIDEVLATSVNSIASAIFRHRSDPVLIRAVGDCEICAGYLQLRLGERGIAALPYSERGIPLTLTPCAHESKAPYGLLIAINESGIALYPSCRKAAAEAFETIAVTSRGNTPLAQLANVSITITNTKSSTTSYRANYFTAGVLSLFEHVLIRLDQMLDEL